MSRRLQFIICLATAALLGCGDAGEHALVTGKITLDNQPLDEATISFMPSGGSQAQAAWSMVKGGQYTIDEAAQLAPGPTRVEIRATRSTGKIIPAGASAVPGGEPEQEMKEVIPSRYNTASTLSAELKPGENVLDFDLKSR
jgi:hypothetical protein